jgi:hypothetical protein
MLKMSYIARRYKISRWLSGSLQRKKVDSGIRTAPLHLLALICKGLTVYGVNSE